MITEWESTGCIEAGVATLACIPVVIQNLVNALIIIAGVICVFLIMWAGYKFIMSEGDPEKVSTARKTFIYALVGFIFILMSFFFLNVIAEFTGVDRIAPKDSNARTGPGCTRCPSGDYLCQEDFNAGMSCDDFATP